MYLDDTDIMMNSAMPNDMPVGWVSWDIFGVGGEGVWTYRLLRLMLFPEVPCR